jgi:hypothetical protein
MEVTRAILKAATDHPMCAGWILESEEAQKVELEKEYC